MEEEEKKEIKWYSPMRRQIEKEMENYKTIEELPEESLRESWFIEQIRTILSGGEGMAYEDWKTEIFSRK